MVLKYLEFYRKLYYTNGDNIEEDEIWLAALTAKNFTELNEMLSHILSNRDRSRFVKEAIRMSRLNFSLRDWETEKMNDLMREESKRVDREEGFQAGIEQKTKEIILSMVKSNATLDFISKVTNKTIDEIKEIIKEQ